MIKHFLFPFWHRFVLGFLLLSLNSYLIVEAPLYVKNAIDFGITKNSLQGLQHAAGWYMAIYCIVIVSQYTMITVLESLGQDILIKMKLMSFDKVLHWNYAMFTDMSAGRLVSRVESDAEKVRFFFVSTTVVLLGSLIVFVRMLYVMFSVNARLAMIVVAAVPVVVVGSILMQKFVFPMFQRSRKYVGVINAKITEYLTGLDIIKAYNREDVFFKEFNSDNKKKFVIDRNAEFISITFFNMIVMLQDVIVGVIMNSSAALIVSGVVTFGVLQLFLEYVRRFFDPLTTISEQISQIQRSFAAFSRVYELHMTPVPMRNGTQPFEGLTSGIHFDAVHFSYKEDEPVLNGISLDMPKGSRWAIVGETGGGKSTIIKLLLRFYDTVSGTVAIDGTDIRTLDVYSLRRRIALIEQDVFLFPASVLDNLRLFDDSIPEDYVRSICKKIEIDDFIMSLPEGYATILHEDGANISAGERQLLSIARAMMRKADIILLDEATSSIDPFTEKKIERALALLCEGKTSIIIAHRLSTVRNAGKILVLSKGEIKESGTHKELFDKGELYYTLCKSQLTADEQKETDATEETTYIRVENA